VSIELGSTARRARGFATRATLGAAGGYLLLTLALTYPLWVHPASTTFPGSSDRNLYIWTLAWDAHALLHRPLAIFDANIFYPYRWTLAYSENLIGVALLVAPLAWALQNPVLTMNVAALASVPLCAIGAFVLARRLGLSAAAAWICGLVYGFAPPRFLRIDQAHLTAVEWIPFSLAFAHAYVSTGRKNDLRLAIAFLSLQALSSGHGAVFLLVALGLWLLFALITGTRPAILRSARDAGWQGALLLLPALLVFIPYRLVQVDVGLRRDLSDWGGSWTSFLSSPTHVDAWILEHLGAIGAFVNANTQAYLFPGWLPLVLAAAAFIRMPPPLTRRDLGRVLVRIVVSSIEVGIAIAIAAGLYAGISGANRLIIGPLVVSLRSLWRPWAIAAVLVVVRTATAKRTVLDVQTPVRFARWCAAGRNDGRLLYLLVVIACGLLAIGPPYGPWRFLYWLPGLSFIRVPSRFMILAMLGLGVLSGYGLERMTAHSSSRRRWTLVLALSAAMAVEFAVVPFELVPNPVVIPAADRWLASQPTPFAIAEVPLMDPTVPMLHSMVHWQKTVHGYSGWNPQRSQEIIARLATFPDAESLTSLQQVGVTFVVVHGAMYSPEEWQRVQMRFSQFADRLTLRFSDGDDRVYQLR
jgi:hypothetical protein